MKGYSLDPHPSIKVVSEHYAVIRTPRLKRARVPANNVEVVDNLQAAMDKSDPKNHLYAAKVLGPSRSSEGFILYYILEIFNLQ